PIKGGVVFIFFFFQAEDGIRDRTVTGVQTCALPIFMEVLTGSATCTNTIGTVRVSPLSTSMTGVPETRTTSGVSASSSAAYRRRSEERRVGKECRSGWSTDH